METIYTDPDRLPLYGVGRRYGNGSAAVGAIDKIDLEVSRGEFLAVVGASGSGKSTLLALLGGLDRPTSGRIEFEGRDLSKLGDDALTAIRLDRIGFVFQQFNLIPTLTALENVEVAMAPTRLGSGERVARARDLLDRVGLGNRGDHLPSELSGGEQQRVAIARALANKPRRSAGRRAHGQSGQPKRRGDPGPDSRPVGARA